MSLIARILGKQPKPPIERALERASKSARHRAAFYRALLDEILWVPGTRDGGAVYVQPFDLDGRRTILIFSSRQKLDDALRRHSGALSVPGQQLLEALPHYDAVVLDYATRLQKELTPSEVAAVLDGSIFGLMSDDERVRRTMLGRPKHYPVQLMNALRPVLQRYDAIGAAYLCQSQDEGATEATIIIGLERNGTSADEALAAGVAEVARCVATVDSSMRVIALDDSATSEFMRRETEAWWTRDASAS